MRTSGEVGAASHGPMRDIIFNAHVAHSSPPKKQSGYREEGCSLEPFWFLPLGNLVNFLLTGRLKVCPSLGVVCGI